MNKLLYLIDEKPYTLTVLAAIFLPFFIVWGVWEGMTIIIKGVMRENTH